MQRFLSAIILFASIISACQPVKLPENTQVPTVTIQPSSTPTRLPATSTPTSTSTPAPSPTPLPPRPDLQPILAENLASLRQERMIGEGRLSDIASSTDGKWIIYATNIGIRLLDGNTLEEKAFRPSTIPVACIELSPDGQTLAAGYENGQIHLYSVASLIKGETNPAILIKAHTFQVTAIQFSPDGTMLGSGSRDRTANIWNVKDGLKLRPLGGFALAVSDVAFSADNQTFAAASLDGTLRVWEIRSGKLLNQAGTADKKRLDDKLYPASVLFQPINGLLWLGWANGTISSWDWQQNESQTETEVTLPSGLLELSVLSEEELVSLDTQGNLTLWLIQGSSIKRGEIFPLNARAKAISILSPNQVVIGMFPAQVERVDVTGKKPTRVYERPNFGSQVTTVVFTAEEDWFLTGSADGSVRIWDVDFPHQPISLLVHTGAPIQEIANDAGQRWLAIASGNQVLVYAQPALVESIQNGKDVNLVAPILTLPTSKTAHRVTISSDGKMMAVSEYHANQIQLYSIPEGKLLGEFSWFEHPVESLAFSPVENTLAAGAKDHRVLLWSPEHIQTLQQEGSDKSLKPSLLKGGYVVTSLVWSPDGAQLAIAGTFKQAHVNNPLDGQVLYYLNQAADQLSCTAFSPDGTLVAATGVDGIVRIYETKRGKLLQELVGHTGMIHSVRFSPSGDRIITAGEDGTVRIWSVAEDYNLLG